MSYISVCHCTTDKDKRDGISEDEWCEAFEPAIYRATVIHGQKKMDFEDLLKVISGPEHCRALAKSITCTSTNKLLHVHVQNVRQKYKHSPLMLTGHLQFGA